MKNLKKMFVTDLDGTLLRSDRTFSKRIVEELSKLKDIDVLRVIATGRSLFSFEKVIPEDFPIDYIVFSSGAGVYDFKNKKIIKSIALESDDIIKIAEVLNELQLNYSIQEEIPGNHRFFYIRNGIKSIDFENRIKIYSEFAESIEMINIPEKRYCQFIIISDNHDVSLYNNIRQTLRGFKVIRTTSPLNGKSIWIEIFPFSVSKAKGVEFLLNKYQINIKNTFSIGNDYNDIDMLDYTESSFLVANGAYELKKKYRTVSSNNDDGVFEVLKMINCTSSITNSKI